MAPWQRSAAQLAAAYARGEAAPPAQLELLLERVAALNPRINAIVALDEAGARRAARESGERIASGRARSVLEGIPVTIKDNILVAGMPCTWGSRLLADFVPQEDEAPVARLRAAGAIVLGKSNTPEFSAEGITSNPVFGTTRNPWNLQFTPGGSSGGAVAAVAAGLAPLALGTDGGGSIRRPASHTGLVGLKPSIGRIARGPSLPQILLDLEVIGPIARTVEDCALLYSALAGPDARDRRSLLGAAGCAQSADEPLRVLYVPRFGDSPLDPEIAASIAGAANALASLGYRIDEDMLPFELAPVTDFWPLLNQVGVAYMAARRAGGDGLLGERFQPMAHAGRGVSATRYLEGIEAIESLRRAVTIAFERIDLIMTPSAAALPWPAEQPFPETIDGRAVGPRGHAVYTGWVNACGHPAINLPCAPSRAGLPIGFQLVGRFGADALLLEIGKRYEAVRPWRERWPSLAFEA